MKVYAYSVYDKKLERGNLPFYARSDQEALLIVIRSNPPKVLYQDLEIRKLFEIDDETLEIVMSPDTIILPPYPAEGAQNG